MEIVKEKKTTVIVLCRCPLQQRIASSITDFIYSHGGTIIDFEQYVDVEMDPASYYARLEWDLGTGGLDVDQVRSQFDVEVAKPFSMEWEVFDSSKPCGLAILGTTEIGGLYKILMSCLSGGWNAEVPLIVSNRTNLEQEAKRFGIAFHHFPITKENKKSQELEMRRLFAEHQIDLVVLARYMQIVSSILIDPNRSLSQSNDQYSSLDVASLCGGETLPSSSSSRSEIHWGNGALCDGRIGCGANYRARNDSNNP